MKTSRLALLISAFQALSTVALLTCSSWLIARASEQPNIVYLSVAIVGVRAFAISRAASRYADRIVSHSSTFRTLSVIRLKVFKSLLKVSAFKMTPNLDSFTRVVDDSQEKPLRIDPVLIRFGTTLVLASAIWLVIAPSIFLYLLALTVISMALSYILASLQQRNLQQINDVQLSRLNQASAQLIENQPVLRSFNWLHKEFDEITKATDELNRAKEALALRSGWSAATSLAGTYSVVLLAILAGTELLRAGSISAPLFVVLVLLPLAVFEILTEITSLPEVLGKYRNSKKHLEALFSDASNTPAISGIELEKVITITVKEFRFQRGESSIQISDFETGPSGTIGILGESGSGKTTFAMLLAGLLSSTKTGIQINDKDIAEYSPESLRKHIGLLEQDPTIFSGSLKANLLMAKPLATDQELIEVLNKVRIWNTFANREGLQTLLGEGGANISGGEAQRVALARILLADFDVVVCDEPTSSLQAELAENLVSDILKLATQNKLVFLISHEPYFTAQTQIQVTASAIT